MKWLSRRETEEYIRKGKIKVNGEVINDLGRQIDPEKDKVEIIGDIEEKTTVVFNKPRGISTPDIVTTYPQFKDLHPVGRLDKESEGLILLSNDGIVTKMVTGNDHLIEKEYLVEVKEKISETQLNAMRKGMRLDDGPTLPTNAERINDHTFTIVLREGRNHQIRRMANHVRLTITKLVRIRIGKLEIDNLDIGESRQLSPEEVRQIKNSY